MEKELPRMYVAPSALTKWLKVKSPDYCGKLSERREVISGWLSYIPQSFPHYTRHTIEHSEKIIEQISKILFEDDDSPEPSTPLTGVEGYILCAAAMLHDSGMVVSDSEKASLLASESWTKWTSEGTGAERWKRIGELRSSPEPNDPAVRNFLADVQVRFLIAEFVRARHHERSGQLLLQSENALARADFGDMVLLRTIADVCVAHGIDNAALNDNETYPVNRDIRSEKVDVRWLAILLRLGDLLDMDSDRACPILLNAACPLPAESRAHWTQYRRIVHRATTPQAIEIVAACENQEEHRVLADWCAWIKTEAESASRLLAGSPRHSNWKAPKAEIGDGREIVIRPSASATYIPSNWRLVLDEGAVLNRLINSTYAHPLAFVRELIQNAVDATRCQLAADLKKIGDEYPTHPVELPVEMRGKYPIRISLRRLAIASELSEQTEQVCALSVADDGIGMDRSIVEKYFLQVGRSYYATPEFRRQYSFLPIGRFGVGFLSVFSASDHVTVNTRSERDADGLRLTLTGPRNYLLLSKAANYRRGTTVEVRLRSPIDDAALVNAVTMWCKRIEFPIVVSTDSTEKTIYAEDPAKFERKTIDFSRKDAHFQVRQFPFSLGAVRGEVYIFSHLNDDVSWWNRANWARYTYAKSHPLADVPDVPPSIVCLNGIFYGDFEGRDARNNSLSIRLDSRGAQQHVTLDRQIDPEGRRTALADVFRRFPQVSTFVASMLDAHLLQRRAANLKHEWIYLQSLIDVAPLIDYWKTHSETTRIFEGGVEGLTSINNVSDTVELVLASSMKRFALYEPTEKLLKQLEEIEQASIKDISETSMTSADVRRFSALTQESIFAGRSISRARTIGEVVLIQFTRASPPKFVRSQSGSTQHEFVAIEGFDGVGILIDDPAESYRRLAILNERHPLVAWLRIAKRVCEERVAGLDNSAYASLVSLLREAVGYGLPTDVGPLNAYLDHWRALPNLKPEFHPPHTSDREYRQENFGEDLVAVQTPGESG
jgi:molecular chaperone HtpG